MGQGEICGHCGVPVDAVAAARQRLIEASLRYALATHPNGHPADTAFREAIHDLILCSRHESQDDGGRLDVEPL